MMNFSSHHSRQDCQRDTDSTTSPSGAKILNLRRVSPQTRQVQRVVRRRRQCRPSVRPLQSPQWPGVVSNSQPHDQHTHLVTAPAAFCTNAPSVEHLQTLQWACCHPVTRQSMNRLWPQPTHTQIMTGLSRLGTRRHRVRWPHVSQWASWGLKYGSRIWAFCGLRGPSPENRSGLVRPSASDSVFHQGSSA